MGATADLIASLELVKKMLDGAIGTRRIKKLLDRLADGPLGQTFAEQQQKKYVFVKTE